MLLPCILIQPLQGKKIGFCQTLAVAYKRLGKIRRHGFACSKPLLYLVSIHMDNTTVSRYTGGLFLTIRISNVF